MANTSIVQEMYAAFGQGDVPAILTHLSPSVEWEYGANESPIPWIQPGRGHAGAAAFFSSLNALEFHKFVPKTFLETDGIVVALVDLEVTVKATGKQIREEDEVHIWHFDENGKVVRFRHRADTLQHYLANQP
ncbi:MAG: nuclear transport factor 2 family protein [Bacteroidota bacterium]|nr:nuclear transport factor 2 family protein [Bacteroidota bacterium]